MKSTIKFCSGILAVTLLIFNSCSSDDGPSANIDRIEALLSTSKAVYSSASAGDWIVITESEYNILAQNLNQITKVGSSDADFDSAPPIDNGGNGFTVVNNNGATIPSDSYVFAFKYDSYGDGAATSNIKISSPNVSGTYSNLGNNLPNHAAGLQYFVLKGNQSPTTDVGHLALFESTGIGYIALDGSSIYAIAGDQDNFDSSNELIGILLLYQGLSTTQKQWD